MYRFCPDGSAIAVDVLTEFLFGPEPRGIGLSAGDVARALTQKYACQTSVIPIEIFVPETQLCHLHPGIVIHMHKVISNG